MSRKKPVDQMSLKIESRSVNESFARVAVSAFAAQQPLFTTLGGERAGLGFAVMESFMDKVRVRSVPGKGTSVTMDKFIKGRGDGQG